MATAKQIEANRRNARKSTGPTSEAGKAASAGNATRHGLFSSVLHLDADELQTYEQLHAGLTRRFRPADELERLLLDRAAVAMWKLRKTLSAQANLLLDTPWDRYPGNLAGSVAAIQHASQINWLRYEQHFERAMYRALKALRDYQALRAHDPDLLGISAEEAPAQNEPNIDISAGATSSSSPAPRCEVVESAAPVASDTPEAPVVSEAPAQNEPNSDDGEVATGDEAPVEVSDSSVCKNEPNPITGVRPGAALWVGRGEWKTAPEFDPTRSIDLSLCKNEFDSKDRGAG